jgi:DNA-binding MarR family transcriptional regulator
MPNRTVVASARPLTLAGLRQAHLLAQLLGDRIARGHGVTMQQWELLNRLHCAGGAADQRDLCCDFGVTPPTLTALVDAAERRGWIARRPHPDDRRRRRVELTPAGRDVVERTPDLAREIERRMTAGLSDDECAALAALLRRAAVTLEEECSCPR